MELERHLSASSTSRNVHASSGLNKHYENSSRLDSADMISMHSEDQCSETDLVNVTSDRVDESGEQVESANRLIGDNSNDSTLEGRYGSSG